MAKPVDKILERAKKWVVSAAPLAPYWEGRTFEDALTTNIQELPSEVERTMLYQRLFALIDRDDPTVQDQAFSRVYDAFSSETWEEAEEQPQGRATLPARMAQILALLEPRLAAKPDLWEEFGSHFSTRIDDPAVLAVMLDWIHTLQERGEACPLPQNALLAASILYGAYGETWSEAGDRLMAALDHEDRNVRACAAYQLGKFCKRLAPSDPEDLFSYRRDYEADRLATEGMEAPEYYWETIRSKEIQRSGVAGAFWQEAPKAPIDEDEWMLALLEQSEPEPYLPYFPCGLAFYAHERYSENPAAIRRLMDAGRLGLALEAATESREPIVGMEPLLQELAESAEPIYTRLASWTLAYLYNRLDPRGEQMGFVEQYAHSSEGNLYLLFSELDRLRTPYAVVLYPKPSHRYWTAKKAHALVDRLFPPSVRGEGLTQEWASSDTTYYQRGYVKFAPAGKRPDARGVLRITIGYRSDVPWNPMT